MLFQRAIALGRGSDFVWLLALHPGKFGSINLEMVYPLLNGLGLLALLIIGPFMWWQGPHARRRTARL